MQVGVTAGIPESMPREGEGENGCSWVHGGPLKPCAISYQRDICSEEILSNSHRKSKKKIACLQEELVQSDNGILASIIHLPFHLSEITVLV